MRRTGLRVHELEAELKASAAAGYLPIDREFYAESLRCLGDGGFIGGQSGASKRLTRSRFWFMNSPGRGRCCRRHSLLDAGSRTLSLPTSSGVCEHFRRPTTFPFMCVIRIIQQTTASCSQTSVRTYREGRSWYALMIQRCQRTFSKCLADRGSRCLPWLFTKKKASCTSC